LVGVTSAKKGRKVWRRGRWSCEVPKRTKMGCGVVKKKGKMGKDRNKTQRGVGDPIPPKKKEKGGEVKTKPYEAGKRGRKTSPLDRGGRGGQKVGKGGIKKKKKSWLGAKQTKGFPQKNS